MQLYLKFITDIAVYFGADPATAATEMKKVLEFEQKLAKISLSLAERRSAPGGVLSIGQLTKFSREAYPGLPQDWKVYLESLLHVELEGDEAIGLVALQFFEPLSKLIEATDGDVITNYQFTWAASYLMRFLDDKAMKILRDYETKSTGVKVKTPLWRKCLHLVGFNSQVELGLTLITASMYVQKHFKEKAKDEMDEMFKDVREALEGTIDEAEWMDEDTKEEAKLKLNAMKQIVGYPPEMVNQTLMTNLYEGLDLIQGELMQNSLDINRFENLLL